MGGGEFCARRAHDGADGGADRGAGRHSRLGLNAARSPRVESPDALRSEGLSHDDAFGDSEPVPPAKADSTVQLLRSAAGPQDTSPRPVATDGYPKPNVQLGGINPERSGKPMMRS